MINIFQACQYLHHHQGRQLGLKSAGAEKDFSRLRDLEARNILHVRNFETIKTVGANAPPALTCLAPLSTIIEMN